MSGEVGFTHLRKSDRFNSTDFTSCCGLAVSRNDGKCPGCRKIVIRSEPVRGKNCMMCDQPRNICCC